jgi:hypothetical protein
VGLKNDKFRKEMPMLPLGSPCPVSP